MLFRVWSTTAAPRSISSGGYGRAIVLMGCKTPELLHRRGTAHQNDCSNANHRGMQGGSCGGSIPPQERSAATGTEPAVNFSALIRYAIELAGKTYQIPRQFNDSWGSGGPPAVIAGYFRYYAIFSRVRIRARARASNSGLEVPNWPL